MVLKIQGDMINTEYIESICRYGENIIIVNTNNGSLRYNFNSEALRNSAMHQIEAFLRQRVDKNS